MKTDELYRRKGHLKAILDEKQCVDDKIKNIAFDLYKSMEIKPKFDKNISVQQSEEIKINRDFFNSEVRINHLIEWAEIVPILKLIREKGDLPIERAEEDFESFVCDFFETFIKELDELPENKYLEKKDVQFLREFKEFILNAIQKYLDGQPALAFKKLDQGMELLNKEDTLDKLRSDFDTPLRYLYRMRIGNNEAYTIDDMFHIPFEKRGIIQTNRYSIPGFPCLYLGSSTLVCWEELGRPDLNKVQTSLFIPNEKLSFLDISLPPKTIVDNVRETFWMLIDQGIVSYELKKYLALWVLLAACSIRVKNPNDVFKVEYIIPQLLLQWVRLSSNFDGICYFSTKFKEYNSKNADLYKNYVFPVKK
ncbi:hypothetical protein QP576_20245 [Bacillus licheniformis]|uniref:hypothetical protein n=2 Tax=Bacillaceae TaxID=186817 RepID=UPI00254A4C87|nr:hypothetical protein [Bacillus licheniformis]MDK7626036.1 hypothetical protein [Bacillus licheniformis]MED7755577.1 hypothetical protein [Bacillus licheniformis]